MLPFYCLSPYNHYLSIYKSTLSGHAQVLCGWQSGQGIFFSFAHQYKFHVKIFSRSALAGVGGENFSSGPETDLGGPDETAVLRGVFW